MVSIRVENVSKFFGTVRALERVSLEIDPGEIFFLLGPSGCGKTTLLRTLAGFCRPEEGRIFFDGRDVTVLPAHLRNTAMMFQSYALWPHMNVHRNIAFGLEQQKLSRDKVETKVKEALAMVKMEGYGHRTVNALSGGQQQRVALARALVVRPHCLLLDEPLSNLDAGLRLEMRSEIRRICKQFGLTSIYVTHDQKEALAIADRIAILSDGQLAQVGSPDTVYRRPLTKAVAAFIGETNFLSGKIRQTSGRDATVDTPAGRFQARISDPDWKPGPDDPVTVSLRPETLYVVDAGRRKDDNCVSGMIQDPVYLGDLVQYTLVTDDGTRLRVSELNPPRQRQPGDVRVHAHARKDDVIILRS